MARAEFEAGSAPIRHRGPSRSLLLVPTPSSPIPDASLSPSSVPRSSRGSKRSHESIRAAKYTAAISETVDVLDAIEIMELEDRSSHNGSSNNSGSHDGGGKDEIDDILAAMDDVTAFDIDEAIDQVLSGKGAGVPGQGRGEASPKVRDGGAREEEEEEEEGDDESNGISSNGISSVTESHCPEAGEEP